MLGVDGKVLPGGHPPFSGIQLREGDAAAERGINMGQNQPVGPGHSGSISSSATADKQLCRTACSGHLKSLCHTGNGLANGWDEVRVTRQYQRVVIFKPAKHFYIRAAANEQPLVTGGTAKVLNVPWQVPGHAFVGGNEAIGGNGGDEGQYRA